MEWNHLFNSTICSDKIAKYLSKLFHYNFLAPEYINICVSLIQLLQYPDFEKKDYTLYHTIPKNVICTIIKDMACNNLCVMKIGFMMKSFPNADPTFENHTIFVTACEQNNIVIAYIMILYYKHYSFVESDGIIISYKIDDNKSHQRYGYEEYQGKCVLHSYSEKHIENLKKRCINWKIIF